MEFKEAMDALGLTAADVARALGLKDPERAGAQRVRQMRLGRDNPSSRPPPAGWPKKLAALGKKRGKELARVAGILEKQAGP